LGCGDGALLEALWSRGYLKKFDKVLAVDIAPERVARARRIDPAIEAFVGDASKLHAIPDASISLAMSNQVIEHVPDEEGLIREIARVLTPGGCVYLSTVFKKPWAWYFYRCRGRWVLDPTHLREYESETYLRELCGRSGLRVKKSQKTLFWFPLTDYFFRRLRVRSRLPKNKFIRLLRKIKMPIPGYYEWGMLMEKP
jgi:ubiquinone/menaquinone biosynthesis C-methylase UbiE